MLNAFKQARAAFSLLNSQEVANRANRPVHIGLVSTGGGGYQEMEDFFAPVTMRPADRAGVREMIHRAADVNAPGDVDLVVYEQGLPAQQGTYTYYRGDPSATVDSILDANGDLHLSLARHFPAFRKPVVDRIIQSVARENAIFAIATALPDVIPNLMELPWALGEWATDTAFLTANQVRMAFQIAAICGKDVGFTAQKLEVLSIGASAFGWRAIARELVGKIPLGGGLIPKGAIAYAGTVLVGKALEKVHQSDMGYTREESRGIYEEALEKGKQVAAGLIHHVKQS